MQYNTNELPIQLNPNKTASTEANFAEVGRRAVDTRNAEGLAGNMVKPIAQQAYAAGNQDGAQAIHDKIVADEARRREYQQVIADQEANRANGMPSTYVPYEEEGLIQGITR